VEEIFLSLHDTTGEFAGRQAVVAVERLSENGIVERLFYLNNVNVAAGIDQTQVDKAARFPIGRRVEVGEGRSPGFGLQACRP